MESKHKMYMYVVAISCVAVIVLSLGLMKLHNNRTRIFVENGYTLQTLQGATGAVWALEQERCVDCNKNFRILPAEK